MQSAPKIGPPVPSLTYVKYYIYALLVRHPLIISPPIYHPLTGEQVKITKWRLISGKELSDQLTCSVFNASNLGESFSMIPPNNWNAGSCSVSYENKEMGVGTYEDVYYINIKLHMTGMKIGNRSTDPNLITIPKEAVTHPDQWLHTKRSTQEVELWIDPIDDILGDYLGLLRIVVTDLPHRYIQGPLILNSIEPLYGNLRSIPWDKEDGMIWREADMMLRVTTRTASGWRDRFNCAVRGINVTLTTMEE